MRATYLDLLGENAAALESVERSLKLSDCDIPKRCKLRSYLNCVRSLPDQERAKLWLFCKLKAEQDMRRGTERPTGEAGDSTENGASSDGGDRCKSDIMVVDRVKYADLSVEQFLGKPSNAVRNHCFFVTVPLGCTVPSHNMVWFGYGIRNNQFSGYSLIGRT